MVFPSLVSVFSATEQKQGSKEQLTSPVCAHIITRALTLIASGSWTRVGHASILNRGLAEDTSKHWLEAQDPLFPSTLPPILLFPFSQSRLPKRIVSSSTMKFAIIASLLASASAFAPAKQAAKTTSLAACKCPCSKVSDAVTRPRYHASCLNTLLLPQQSRMSLVPRPLLVSSILLALSLTETRKSSTAFVTSKLSMVVFAVSSHCAVGWREVRKRGRGDIFPRKKGSGSLAHASAVSTIERHNL